MASATGIPATGGLSSNPLPFGSRRDPPVTRVPQETHDEDPSNCLGGTHLMLNENMPANTVEDIIAIAQAMRKLDYFVRNHSIDECEKVIDLRGREFPHTPVMVGEIAFRHAIPDGATYRSVSHQPSDGQLPRDFYFSPSDDCA